MYVSAEPAGAGFLKATMLKNRAEEGKSAGVVPTHQAASDSERFEEAPRIRQLIVNANLRASRETELRDELRSHVVDAWIGHCEEIAKRQDLMVTDDHFAQASEDAVRKPVTLLQSPRDWWRLSMHGPS